jgi:[ribosomal protein S18]-alanine N-acetyltransferase
VIRPLRWWDLDAVVRLEQELFGPTAWTAEAFWSELAQPSRWYVAAVDGGPDAEADGGPDAEADGGPDAEADGGPGDGCLLGYAGLMVTGAEADVQTLAVAASAQGRGLGARLLDALLAEAAARGATSCLLEVRADNAAAIALYRRRGFERLALRRRYYQPGDVDALVMRLRPLAPRDGGPGPGPE